MPGAEWPPALAEPTSALGQLQRGQGAVARSVLEDGVADARQMVLNCIRVDPRWDRQLDARAGYYAELVPALAITPQELLELVRAEERVPSDVDRGICLSLEVLLRCAVTGLPGALEGVNAYLLNGHYWSHAVESLALSQTSWKPHPNWQARVMHVPDLMKARFKTADDLRQAFLDADVNLRQTPWRDWAVNDRELGAAMAASSRASRPAATLNQREAAVVKTTSELLAASDPMQMRLVARELASRDSAADVAAMLAVALDPSSPARAVAVSALAAQGRAEALPVVQTLTQTTRPLVAHALLFRALAALPYEITRLTVLEWVTGGDRSRRRAAAAAMGVHARSEDVPLIRDLLTTELDEGLAGEQYLICSYADALGQHPELGPFPELRRAFNEMPYSYGRRFVVAALAATDRSFAATGMVDCLWDAEDETRASAAANVDSVAPGAFSRLKVLAADGEADADVRAAAEAALGI